MKRIIAGFAVVAGTAFPAVAEMHRATMRDMAFEPALPEVAVGDVILFANSGGAAFDTGRIDPDAAIRVRITRTGAIDYVCKYHPPMRGRIVAN